MAKRKGMSLEEKRDTMLGLFFETKEVFNLKELTSIGGKRGVVTNTVEEVVKSLVDDRYVECEKIGSGNFYWAFPSKSFLAQKTRVEGFQAAAAADNAAVAELEAKLEELTSGVDDAAERAAKTAALEAAKAQLAALDKQLAAYAESDPEALAATMAKAKKAREAADRWTDNVWAMKAYCIEKFGKEPGEVDRMMSIPDDFDYVR